MIETIRARLRGTLTDAEWQPLQELRWKVAEARVSDGPSSSRVHYFGPPRRREFAIVGSQEEILALLEKAKRA